MDIILKKIIEDENTPAYIFDIGILKKRVNYLRSKLSENIFLCYAIKANTFIVKDIEDDVDRFEVCSPGEYEICKHKNINKDKILISGVYKTPDVIQSMALNDGITNFTIESMEQFKLIKKINCKNRLKLILRLTSGNQFGINEEEIEEIIRNINEYKNIEITGIQYFSGTQKVSLKNLKRELDYVDEFIKKIKEKYSFTFKELEFGPGFPVFYFQNTEFNEDAFLEEFANYLRQMKFNGKKILEIGRSIAASCGKYITKVVDMKINKMQNYAILDGGIHHLTYYGQSMAMKTPKCSVYPERKTQGEEKWNLFGSLCTINDILVKQFPVSDLKTGDIFIFENTGAYCMTEGISLFLSRQLPKIIKINNDKSVEIVREHLDTYKINM